MKKIIIIVTILISIILINTNTTFANETDYVNVVVTERIPWVPCEQITEEWESPKMYKCQVKKWTWAIIEMFWNIIKYFTFLAWLFWVLFIVYNGILYSMWWADQSLKEESKKRIIWTLIWLVLLFLSWPILQIIAPWIYK